jgi:hypothetical protein
MPTLTSKPVSVIVQPASTTVQGWGQGSEVGTLTADVWTPGRNAAGAVNAVSWATVPAARWVQVAGTRLDALDTVVKAAIPGWRDYGVSGWDGVTTAWSGFAVDAAGSRLWLMGGGHRASSNNGLYRFDALRMAWAIEDLPSDPATWSAGYRAANSGGYGVCLESAQQAQTAFAAGAWNPVNGWGSDELLWDRKPTARHAYGSMVFVPETNELVMVHYRLWRFSLTQRAWVYKRAIRDSFTPWMDSENGLAIYDEATREVLTSATGPLSLFRSTGYSLTANQWTNWSAPWGLHAGIADVRIGRRVVVVQPASTASGTYAAQPARYWDYNLDTRTVTTSNTLQYADGLAQTDFPPTNWFYDGAALAYIPSKNRFWLCTQMATGRLELLEIDPTTAPWTVRRAPALAGNLPTPANPLERKMIFLPALNAILLCDTASKNLYLCKFG